MAVHQEDIDNHWVWPLVEQGLTVFPLGSAGEAPPAWVVDRSGSAEEARSAWPKMPRGTWREWQSSRPSDQQVADWIMRHPGCNFAIATGKEIDVVDADNQDAIDFVMEKLTRTPWVVRTGKGAHFYYQTNEKVKLKNSADENAKLDTRGVGGYVVAPGSTHPSGRRYELEIDDQWPVESIKDLPCLSAEDLDLIARYKGGGSIQTQIGGALGNLAGFNAAHFAPAITGGVREGGRNNNLARLVGGWIQQGYGVDQVLARAMQTNSGNNPPLSDAEVMAVIASVTRTHVQNHARESQSAPIQKAPEAGKLLLKPSELKTNAPKWLIKDIMPAEGIGCLFGPSGGGKSFAVIDIMLHVAAGRDWHGRQTRKPGSVLYVCGEGLQGIANRLRAWEKHTGISLDTLPLRVTRQPIMFMDPVSVNALADAIEGEKDTLGDVSMLVIDTLNRNFGDGDENTTKDMTRFINALTVLQKTLNTTVLVVHHTGLGADDRARGSSALRAALDFEIQQRVIEGDTPGFCLIGKKMKDGSQIPDGHFSLKFVPLGVDDHGEEFGSCVIETLPDDKVASVKRAEQLGRGNNKKQVQMVVNLAAYRTHCLANQPSLSEVTIERKQVLEMLRDAGYGVNDTSRPFSALEKKNFLKLCNPGVYEVTQAVELVEEK